MKMMNLNNWFTWNGASCLEYGIYVPERSGSLTTLEGD